MNHNKDYYKSLELSKEASIEDVKIAYRRLAKKFHPDNKETGDDNRFRLITEAYSVLNDTHKKLEYDSIRGVSFGTFNGGFHFNTSDFSADQDLGDLYRDFFNRNYAHVEKNAEYSNANTTESIEGEDLEIEVIINLKEAYNGLQKDVSIKSGGLMMCHVCSGHGYPQGSASIMCSGCHGQGRKINLGSSGKKVGLCQKCKGRKRIPTTWCRSCGGKGHSFNTKNIKINIPAGISNDDKLRIAGQGTPGVNSKPGDLFVNIKLDPVHEHFRLAGSDLYTSCRIPIFTAFNGGQHTMKHIDGSDVSIDIPSGFTPGSDIVVKGKGITHPMRKVSGDLHVTVEVYLPNIVSDRAKELIDELGKELNK